MKPYLLLFGCLLLVSLFPERIFAQKINTDSLERLLPRLSNEEEVDALLGLAGAYFYETPEAAFKYSLQALQKAERLRYLKGKVNARILLGDAYMQRSGQGDTEKAFTQYTQALEMIEQESLALLDIPKAKALNGLAGLLYLWGDYQQALAKNLEAARLREQYQDKAGMARAYNACGVVYDALEDYEKAIEFYSKALNLYESLKMLRESAGVLDNLASAFKLQAQSQAQDIDYSQAIAYYTRALQISLQLQDKKSAARTYNNLGIIAFNQKDYQKALELYLKAVQADEALGNLEGIAKTYNNIAAVFEAQEAPDVAISYYEKALEASFEIKAKADMLVSFEGLSRLYSQKNDFAQAFEYARLVNIYKDELSKLANKQQLNNLTLRYELEKQQREVESLARQNLEIELDNSRKRELLFYFVIALVLVALLSVGLIYQNRLRGRLNKLLKERNTLLLKKNEEVQEKSRALQEAVQKLAEKNRNITDSIMYARRIQDAILPPAQELFRGFQEGFVLSKPKSIVSGDFYWYAEKASKKLLVVADCTGHGVPGAFMTVMGHTLLNEIINEQEIIDPAEVLYHLDKKIMTLQNTNQQRYIHDGMDLAIVCFNMDTRRISFAGAKNGLLRIRAGDLLALRGSKFPVGSNQYKTGKRFDMQDLDFQEGDLFYLFTDGFQDQFGGEEGKKYMRKRLHEFLLSIHELPLAAQQIQMGKEITIWKNGNKQTDDMLMLGLKV
jgi:serine phosphatase RsbU (regulator of sigma subunit)